MLINAGADTVAGRESIRRCVDAYMEALQRADALQLDVWLSLGITIGQLRTLRHLEAGPLIAGDLAERVGLHPASMTRTLDKLEENGWVRRTPCDEDRRRVWVTLTSDARARLRQRRGGVRKVLEQAAGSMTPTQRLAMSESLRAFVRALPDDLFASPEPTEAGEAHS